MSNSNAFNHELAQTSIDSAYKFASFSSYIVDGKLHCTFSPICIFCSSNNTSNLAKDMSFKQCNNCRKQFKANISNNNSANQQLAYFPPYKLNN
jgi:hypothetical protein